MALMLAKKEATARHRPIAHGRETPGVESGRNARNAAVEVRRTSETRLQAAVGADRKRDDGDLYADVPCTD